MKEADEFVDQLKAMTGGPLERELAEWIWEVIRFHLDQHVSNAVARGLRLRALTSLLRTKPVGRTPIPSFLASVFSLS